MPLGVVRGLPQSAGRAECAPRAVRRGAGQALRSPHGLAPCGQGATQSEGVQRRCTLARNAVRCGSRAAAVRRSCRVRTESGEARGWPGASQSSWPCAMWARSNAERSVQRRCTLARNAVRCGSRAAAVRRSCRVRTESGEARGWPGASQRLMALRHAGKEQRRAKASSADASPLECRSVWPAGCIN